MKRRGFSLLELMTGLAIIATLATLAMTGGRVIVERAQQRASEMALNAAMADAQRVASRRDIQVGDTALMAFPDAALLGSSEIASGQLVAALSAQGLTFTTDASSGSSTVSVRVVNPQKAVYSVLAGGRCNVAVQQLNGAVQWAYHSGQCSFTGLGELPAEGLSTDGSDPTDLNGSI